MGFATRYSYFCLWVSRTDKVIIDSNLKMLSLVSSYGTRFLTIFYPATQSVGTAEHIRNFNWNKFPESAAEEDAY